jgi:hypothetical protein
MTATSTHHGLAFEYAVGAQLHRAWGIPWHMGFNSNCDTRRQHFCDLKPDLRKSMDAAAHRIAADTDIRARCGTPRSLALGDNARNGNPSDVRFFDARGREIYGISLKWGSMELKDMRFADGWLHRLCGINVNSDWDRAVSPHMARLACYSSWDAAKSDLGLEAIQGPLAMAVYDQLKRAEGSPDATERMWRHIFGTVPYMKIVAKNRGTTINVIPYSDKTTHRELLVTLDERNTGTLCTVLRFGRTVNVRVDVRNKNHPVILSNQALRFELLAAGVEGWRLAPGVAA